MEHVRVDGVRLEARWWRPHRGARHIPEPGGWQEAPVVLLHEGLGSVSRWREFPGRLAERTGRAVLAYSRRGHGRSDARGAPPTVRFMHDEAALLPRVLDAAGIWRAVLFGHSDGGSIALLAAAGGPDRVQALVLEAPHVFVEGVSVASIARIREQYATTNLRARLARHHVHVDDVFSGWNDVWLSPAFRAWNIETELSAVTCPALVLQGADDEYGTPAQVTAVQQGLAGPVTSAIIQNCGHSPHRDQASVVLDSTVRLLSEIPA
jgi:pimeloyl-ACP methyl ester carboxylesterase